MNNYQYPQLFEEHETVHLIIVNSSATVTGVENHEPTITGDTFLLTEDDVDGDSLYLEEVLNSAQNLKFGSIIPSRFEIDIFNTLALINYKEKENTLKGEEIAVYLYFNDNSLTLFQVGIYVITMDEYSDDRSTRHLTCFDVLQDLYDYDVTKYYNKMFEDTQFVTIKDLRDGLFEWLTTPSNQSTSFGLAGDGYEYTLSQETIDLVNDDFEVEYSIESDTVTFGFLMEGLLEANGVFGHIDRTGVFRYISLETYDHDPKRTITEEDAFEPLVYEDYHVWGIGFVAIWDRTNVRLAYEGESGYKHPSVYHIVNSFVFTNNNNANGRIDAIKQAALNLRNQITHMWYYPIESECAGNLCYDVGDRINAINDIYDEETDYVDDEVPIKVKNLYSYMLQREFMGLQEFTDKYYAKGDRKQPRYKVKKDSRWHVGDSQNDSTLGNAGVSVINDTYAVELIKYWRNIGIRLLQEPSNVSVEYDRANQQVSIKWTDPDDITTNAPMPCEWKGTIIVRKEGSRPYHRWDGTVLVNSQVRDEYSVNPFIDDTVEPNKKYYYGIFPYHIHMTDVTNSIAYYRFTKVVSVDTQYDIPAPVITKLTNVALDVKVRYTIPTLESGSYEYIKIVAKKKYIPANKTDGIVKDVTADSATTTMTGFEGSTKYFFVIFAKVADIEVSSDPEYIVTNAIPPLFKEIITVRDSDETTIVQEQRESGYSMESVVTGKDVPSTDGDTITFTDIVLVSRYTGGD